MNRFGLILLAVILSLSTRGSCQFVKKMLLEIPAADESKTTAGSLFFISPEFDMTGLVVKVDTSCSFKDSYIIAGNDTIYLISDNHLSDTSGYITSNLIVFRNKLSEFHFWPGDIENEVEFFFINASPTRKDIRKERRKKKVQNVRSLK